MAKSLSEATLHFLKLSFHMFPYDKILKFSKVESELIFKKASQNTFKYQISATSVRGFGSYDHLKFMPMHQLIYRF